MTPEIYAINAGRGKLLSFFTDRFKSELLTVQFAVPLKEETAQRNTLLFELLCRGTEQYPSKALFSRRLDDMYATAVAPYIRKAGDMQILGFTAEFLGERYVDQAKGLLPEVVQMLSQLLLSPYLPGGVFHTPYLESEKAHLKDAIRAQINNPRSYARAKCRALLFENEPYALSMLGNEETVDAITAQDLVAQWQELLRTVTPVYCYVGATPGEEVAALLSANLSFGAELACPCQTLVRRQEGAPVSVREEMPLCQSRLVLGFRTDITLSHPLAPATSFLNTIFGGSAASKLFLNVREKRSICYHCSSSFDAYKGALFAESGISAARREEAELAIRAEFEAILRGEISDVEWNAAKRSHEFYIKQALDHPSSISSFYMGRALIGFEETLEQRREAFARITREDVAMAAAHLGEGAVFFLEGNADGEEDEEE